MREREREKINAYKVLEGRYIKMDLGELDSRM
jgi:hypothetical protein